jgi:hypothetical protein
MTTQTTKTLTLGEKRCHINFNPSSDDKIGTFKRMMADAIDFCDNELDKSPLRGDEYLEQVRCFKIAQEHLETAQMYAVKGIAKGLVEKPLPTGTTTNKDERYKIEGSISTIGVGHLTTEGRKEE